MPRTTYILQRVEGLSKKDLRCLKRLTAREIDYVLRSTETPAAKLVLAAEHLPMHLVNDSADLVGEMVHPMWSKGGLIATP